jgi:tetratricopeptide (TPR) repeat protein/predicted Zn-dependent protease
LYSLIPPRNKYALIWSLTIILQMTFPAHVIALTDEVRSMCEQAEQLINSRRFNDAVKLLNKAETIDPTCGEVHGYLGMAYQNNSNTKQAVEEYSKALQLNPQMSFINVNLGTCYMNLGQQQQAAPYFQKYLQENPNAPDAAQVRKYLQQSGSSQNLSGSNQNQSGFRSLVEHGQALVSQGKFADARNVFEQAVREQPNFAPAHFYLGYTLAQTGQCMNAIGEFNRCLQLDPSTKEAVLNIGSNYQSLGDAANAITWYEKYIRENPSSPKVADLRQRISGLRQQAKQPGNEPGAASQNDYLASAASGGRWFHWMRFPVRVCIAGGAGVGGYRDSFSKLLIESFSMWAQGSENRLAFALVNDPSQAEIYCTWTDNPNQVAEGGRAVEGGLTKLSGQPQMNGDIGIANARMILLTNRGGTPLSDDDMRKVCLHEVGHALGINGHSSNNSDVMFYTESPTVWPALTNRDKATICGLYRAYPKLSP